MSDGPTGEPASGLSPDQDELATTIGDRLARSSRAAQAVARSLAVVVVGVGLVALAEGLVAWRSTPWAMAVVALLCLPAILAPLRVVCRTKAMAAAGADPAAAVAQSKDLVRGLLGSPDLAALEAMGRRVRHEHHPEARGTGFLGRVRSFRTVTKLVSAVVEQAKPDRNRHPLLVPFTPDRLAGTWAAVTFSLWGLALAIIVLVVSFPVLIISVI